MTRAFLIIFLTVDSNPPFIITWRSAQVPDIFSLIPCHFVSDLQKRTSKHGKPLDVCGIYPQVKKISGKITRESWQGSQQIVSGACDGVMPWCRAVTVYRGR